MLASIPHSIRPGLQVSVLRLVAVVMAVASGWHAFIAAERATAPDLVAEIATRDGVALALVLDRGHAGLGPLPATDERRRKLAHALADEPLQPAVIRLMATERWEHDRQGAIALLTLGAKVSSRDLATQVALIDVAIAHNDIANALAHYDAALATHEEAKAQLFPLLANALQYDEVRRQLRPLVMRSPTWMQAFLLYAGDKAPPEAIAKLLSENAAAIPSALVASLRRKVITAVLTHKAYDEAFRMVRTFSGPQIAQTQSMNITRASADPTFYPFTWMIEGLDSGQAAILPAGGIRTMVPTDRTHTLLQRMILLPPGSYDFGGVVGFSDDDPAILSVWTWRCLMDGDRVQELASRDFPAKQEVQTITMNVQVPENCRALTVELRAVGSDERGERSMVISSVALRQHLDPK